MPLIPVSYTHLDVYKRQTSLFSADMPDFATVTAGRLFDEMDPADKETLRYACADSDYTLRLYHKFNNWFAKNLPHHREIVERVESPTSVYCCLLYTSRCV